MIPQIKDGTASAAGPRDRPAASGGLKELHAEQNHVDKGYAPTNNETDAYAPTSCDTESIIGLRAEVQALRADVGLADGDREHELRQGQHGLHQH